MSQARPGPSTADEVMLWAQRYIHRLQTHGTRVYGEDLASSLHKKLGQLVLTTAFSGIGGAEESLRHLMLALEDAGYARAKLVVREAVDIDSAARAVLVQHAEEVRPEHIFEDVVHLAPESLLESVMALRDEPTCCDGGGSVHEGVAFTDKVATTLVNAKSVQMSLTSKAHSLQRLL